MGYESQEIKAGKAPPEVAAVMESHVCTKESVQSMVHMGQRSTPDAVTNSEAGTSTGYEIRTGQTRPVAGCLG